MPEFSERTDLLFGAEHATYHPLLYVATSGSSLWAHSHAFTRSRSELFGVEIVTAGNAVFEQDGRSYTVVPGDVYLLRMGARHRYAVGPAGFLCKRHVTMQGSLLDALLRQSGLITLDHIRPRDPHALLGMFRQSRRLLAHKPPNLIEESSVLAFRILSELAASLGPRMPSTVQRGLDFIERNLAVPVSTADICAAAGMSATHFHRLFKRHLGVAPMQYLITQRMNWAKHLLSNTALSVKEIAATVGYDDPLYFSAQFRKHEAVSPRGFRRGMSTGRTVTSGRHDGADGKRILSSGGANHERCQEDRNRSGQFHNVRQTAAVQ